jgi:hypothetical protein
LIGSRHAYGSATTDHCLCGGLSEDDRDLLEPVGDDPVVRPGH